MTIKADNGYFFGVGVFETIKVIKGRCIFLPQHLNRLAASAAFFSLEDTINEKDVYQYLKAYCPPNFSGALKITLSARNRVFSTRENPYKPQHYEKGFSLTFSEVRRNETSSFTYHKTLNCGDNIREKNISAEQGFDEVIFLNTQGEIAEGAVSNIFFVKNGGIFTPPVTAGLLNGIIRQYLLSNYQITETAMTMGALSKFDECFITNSLMGIMPVRSLGEKTFSHFNTAKQLKKEYDEAIKSL